MWCTILAQNRQQPLSGNKNILFILFIALSLNLSFGQSKGEFQKKYAESKDLYNKQDYNLAYEGFRLLTQPNKNNAFEQTAHYYTGLSAFKVGKLLDAKFILVKAINNYPDWKQLYEVKYVLAQIAFAEKDYNRAFEICSEIIFEKSIQEDVVKLIRKEVITAPQFKEVIQQQLKHPENFTLAKAIADRIKYFGGGVAEKMLLQYLIQDYGFNPDQYAGTFSRPTVKKTSYNIAVLLPYEINEKMNWGHEGKTFEMLEGIKLAAETLEKKGGAKFNIYAYDTKKDPEKVRALLKLPEFKTMDVIIGASLNTTGEVVKRFAEANQIHYVNPLNGDPALIGTYSKLFKPSYTEIGHQLAIAAVDSFPHKRQVAIIYGSNKRDSLIAISYKKSVEALGKKVVVFKGVHPTDGKLAGSAVSKLKFDSLSHIAVFTKEDLIATNFMSALEGRIAGIEAAERVAATEANRKYTGTPIHVPVLAPIEWLDLYIIQFEQFMRRGVHFYNVDYIDFDSEEPNLFREAMKVRMGVKPSTDYAAVGYDLMLLYGKMLNKYGNSFADELADEGFIKGYNFRGVDYSNGVSNAVVPLLKINKDFKLIGVNLD